MPRNEFAEDDYYCRKPKKDKKSFEEVFNQTWEDEDETQEVYNESIKEG